MFIIIKKSLCMLMTSGGRVTHRQPGGRLNECQELVFLASLLNSSFSLYDISRLSLSSFFSVSLPLYQSINLSVYQSINQSVYLSIYLLSFNYSARIQKLTRLIAHCILWVEGKSVYLIMWSLDLQKRRHNPYLSFLQGLW